MLFKNLNSHSVIHHNSNNYHVNCKNITSLGWVSCVSLKIISTDGPISTINIMTLPLTLRFFLRCNFTSVHLWNYTEEAQCLLTYNVIRLVYIDGSHWFIVSKRYAHSLPQFRKSDLSPIKCYKGDSPCVKQSLYQFT